MVILLLRPFQYKQKLRMLIRGQCPLQLVTEANKVTLSREVDNFSIAGGSAKRY